MVDIKYSIEFHGDGYAEIPHLIQTQEYSITFNTTQAHGLIVYKRQLDGGLMIYIEDGFLIYLYGL